VPAAARRSRPALSLLVWLLCVLLGPGPALPALHFALVQHRICPEHGELLHVGNAAEAAPASPVSARDPAQAGAAEGSAEAGARIGADRAGLDEHGHEVCGLSGVAGNLALLPARAHSDTLPATPAAQLSPSAERAHVRVALLRYAPKLPPPCAPAPGWLATAQA
jgi:hypothetical protein